MAAYALAHMTILNTDWQKEYGEKMPALLARHGGKLLARAPLACLEGQPATHERLVMIEFPSADQARAWHADPEHAHLQALRQGGARCDMHLVEGV